MAVSPARTPPRLSPRQHECLKLVYDRQATSKEIAAELGIGKATVDSYIAEAVEATGARDRREAAAMVFGGTPRGESPPVESGGDSARGAGHGAEVPPAVTPTETIGANRPWRTDRQPNRMTLVQTLGWIAAIAVGSLAALALAISVGNGLPSIAWPAIQSIGRLTQ